MDAIERRQEERTRMQITLVKRGETEMKAKEQTVEEPAEKSEETVILKREELYRDIWQTGITRTAKKYGIPYALFKQACRAAEIPLPTQSYWGNLAVGKPVEKPELPRADSNDITIEKRPNHKRTKDEKRNKRSDENAAVKQTSAVKKGLGAVQPSEHTEKLSESFVHKKNRWGGTLYERETLYQELWSYPAVMVAKTYGVSDVMIHKACKKLNVPTPPPGYWAKKKAGQNPPVIPLPEGAEHTVFPFNGIPKTDKDGETITDTGIFEDYQTDGKPAGDGLEFLALDEYERWISTANSLHVAEGKRKLHWVLQNHRHTFTEWSKLHTRDELAAWPKGLRWHVPEGEPAFWTSISTKTLSRVYSLLDALFHAVESLGGTVRKDLCFEIRGGIVSFSLSEGQTKVSHVLSKAEQRDWDRYEKEKLRSTWASKPLIRKYDYIPNGNLTLRITDPKFYRDSKNLPLELRLGEVLLDLYRESEAVRIAREERAAEQRRREEEARLREWRRQRKQQEIDRFKALENEAEDYDKACKLRAFIAAVEADPVLSAEKEEWIAWAKAKADWIDPLVSAADPFFGQRAHAEDEADKRPQLSCWD